MNHEAVFRDYVDAYNAGDVKRMVSFFDDDCVFENISAGKVTARTVGKPALEALARKSAQSFASREQKVVTLTRGDDRVVAEVDFSGLLQTDLSPELPSGTRMRLRGVTVADFANGRIVRLTDYN